MAMKQKSKENGGNTKEGKGRSLTVTGTRIALEDVRDRSAILSVTGSDGITKRGIYRLGDEKNGVRLVSISSDEKTKSVDGSQLLHRAPKLNPEMALSLHLSNEWLIQEWAEALDGGPCDCDLSSRLQTERKVTESELLAAIQEADKNDPKIKKLLVQVAQRSGYDSVREAARKALEQS
jgi:hypothetical protein